MDSSDVNRKRTQLAAAAAPTSSTVRSADAINNEAVRGRAPRAPSRRMWLSRLFDAGCPDGVTQRNPCSPSESKSKPEGSREISLGCRHNRRGDRDRQSLDNLFDPLVVRPAASRERT